MPRLNSTTWNSWEGVSSSRLNAFNADIDNIYATGSDHFKVYHLSAQPALQVTIGPGTYRVWASEGQYAGWTLTVSASVTTYIMVDSSGAIQTSTSAWNVWYTRLAIVVSWASTITSITDWRNKVVGGELWGTPSGSVYMWPTGTAPTWHLLCDWQAVSRTTYATLFWIISTTYWVGDGSTTFNLPNFKGRVPVGFDSWQVEFDTLGETGGAKTHTLWTTEIASHSHTYATHGGGGWGLSPIQRNTGSSAQASGTTDNAGWWLSHNNLQPYLTLNFIIKT